MVLKCLIAAFFSFLSYVASGQTRLIGDRLHKILTIHQYHCDIELKKFDTYLMHEEVPVKMLFLSYQSEGDSLFIKGRVADYTSEGMPASVYLATITDSTCNMEQKLTMADMNGHFSVRIKKDPHKSLYFTSLSYRDLEIKLSYLTGQMSN